MRGRSPTSAPTTRRARRNDVSPPIEVASDPIPIYSKSLESRLVDADIPVDEDEDPWVPERTPETEGPLDPEATHREI